jgi:hypothetical protein
MVIADANWSFMFNFSPRKIRASMSTINGELAVSGAAIEAGNSENAYQYIIIEMTMRNEPVRVKRCFWGWVTSVLRGFSDFASKK